MKSGWHRVASRWFNFLFVRVHLGLVQQGFLRITGICCSALRSLFAFYRQQASLILSLMGRCSQLEEFKKTTPFTAPEAWPLKCPSYSNLTKLTASHLFQFFERGRKSSWRPERFKNYLFTSKEMATSAGSGYDFCCGLPHNHTMCNSTSIKTLRVIKVRSNLE